MNQVLLQCTWEGGRAHSQRIVNGSMLLKKSIKIRCTPF